MRLDFDSNTSTLAATETSAENNPARELLREGIKAAQAGNRSEARHLLLRVTESDPRNENAWLWLASISEYPEELLVFLKNVLEINPGNERAIEWTRATKSLLAKTFVQRGIDASNDGQIDFANQCFNHALAQDENNELAWLWMASITDSDDEKEAYLQKVLSLDPNNAEAHAGLSVVLDRKAEAQLEEAYKSAAEGAKAHANELLDRVLERMPESEEAWLLRSDLVEDRAARVSILEKVLAINPENAEAQDALEAIGHAVAREQLQEANVAAIRGDGDRARLLLDEALAKSPDMEEGWILRSHLAEGFEDKVRAFEKVLEINPGNVAARASMESLLAIMNSVAPEAVISEPAVTEEDSLAVHEEAARVEEEIQAQEEEAVSYEEDAPAEMHVSEGDGEDRSPTQDLVYPESMAENNPFEDADRVQEQYHEETAAESLYSNDDDVTEEPVAFESHDEVVEEEVHAEDHSHQWPTEEDLPQVAESVEQFDRASEEAEVEEAPEDIEAYQSEETPFSVHEGSEENYNGTFSNDVDEAPVAETESYEDIYAQATAAESDYSAPADVEEAPEVSFEEQPVAEEVEAPASFDEEEAPRHEAQVAACPYCETENDHAAYQCNCCCAVLTLSDLEMLLAHPHANRDMLGLALEKMESEKSFRPFDENELKILGIGHINLKNFKQGFDCLQEAQRLNPNDVILAGQVNALSIRLAEIREQEETQDSMPQAKTILVVDDSATVRKLIAGKLEKCGHEVICAVDGVDALEKIEEIVPDLILLDINMPRMDGYQVCKMIRGNHATENVPVVMISGKDGFFDKVRGRMSGTTGYITKPFGPETLMKALETYIVDDAALEPVEAEQE